MAKAKVDVYADEIVMLVKPTDSMSRHPKNPNRGVVEAIAESLARFGQLRPILCNKKGVIVAGNHTWQAAHDAGWTGVAAVWQKMTRADEDAYLVADNRIAALAENDPDILLELLTDIQGDPLGLLGTGYVAEDIDAMLAVHAPADDGPRGELLKLTDVTIGDPEHDAPVGSVWSLAREGVEHTLVVGDVYEPDDWGRFLIENPALGFAPYPSPHAPFSTRAEARPYLFVTPWPFHAGHLLDAWVDKFGEPAIARVA